MTNKEILQNYHKIINDYCIDRDYSYNDLMTTFIEFDKWIIKTLNELLYFDSCKELSLYYRQLLLEVGDVLYYNNLNERPIYHYFINIQETITRLINLEKQYNEKQ